MAGKDLIRTLRRQQEHFMATEDIKKGHFRQAWLGLPEVRAVCDLWEQQKKRVNQVLGRVPSFRIK